MRIIFITATLIVSLNCGCTRESVRQALATQQRADAIQQAVFDRQHDGLRVLLFRDLTTRLAAGGAPLNDAQQVTLNQAWNERDLIEHWCVQQERAKALRLAGVDAKLFADQSIVDLLIKQAEARFDRAKQAVAGELGADAAGATEKAGGGADRAAPSTPAILGDSKSEATPAAKGN